MRDAITGHANLPRLPVAQWPVAASCRAAHGPLQGPGCVRLLGIGRHLVSRLPGVARRRVPERRMDELGSGGPP